MAWPLYQWYLGRFRIGAGLYFKIKPTSGGAWQQVDITPGEYYLTNYTGESAQLRHHLQAGIVALGYASATVTLDAATGKFTIDSNYGAAVDLDWSGATALQAALGFGTCTGSESYTAPVVARYQWRPSEPICTHGAGDLMRWWTPRSRTVTHISGEGSFSRTVRSALYDGEFSYELLPAADVVIEDGVSGWEPLEQFWADVIDAGEPIRCYPDRTLAASTNIFTGVWPGGGEDGIGSFAEFASQSIEEWDALYSVRFHLKKYLAAT